MSSTRNKNSVGDYRLEQLQNTNISGYSTFINSAYGEPLQSHFAGNGLIMGRMAPTNLCNNSVDVETQLYGIGSTNLVSPKQHVVVDMKSLKSLNVSDRLTTYVPPDFVFQEGQRPYFLN
jgi:hypothetical protein